MKTFFHCCAAIHRFLKVSIYNKSQSLFNLQQITKGEKEIKEIIADRKKLHTAIEEDNLKIVQHFVDKYQTAIIGFNDENIPALISSLKRAMKTNSFEIYTYLLSKGFHAACSSEFIRLERQLNEDARDEITLKMKSFYGKHTSSHLFYLLSRSKFVRDRWEEETKMNFKKVEKMFTKLDSIAEINPILKIFEFVPLMVVFDFKCESVHKILLNQREGEQGTCFYKIGQIYVGASNYHKENSEEFKNRERIVRGVLIHELQHYAMKILFNNESNPFDSRDRWNRKRFMKIVSKYSKISDNHPRIKTVFEKYPKNKWSIELIVCVSQILAQNYSDGIHILTTKYRALYEYYKKVVLKRAKLFLSNPKRFLDTQEIDRLNRQFYAGKIMEREMWLKKSEINFLEPDHLNFVFTNSPHLAMTHIYQYFFLEKSSKNVVKNSKMIFVEIEDLKNKVLRENIYLNFWDGDLDTILVVNCGEFKIEDENMPFWMFEFDKYAQKSILIFKHFESAEKIDKYFPDIKEIHKSEINYRFKDLKQSSKEIILETKANFQNYQTKLKEIVQDNIELIDMLPINKIIENSPIAIGNEIQKNNGYNRDYYVERKFIKYENDDKKIEIPMEAIMKIRGINVLSENAGQGKSTFFTHLALKFKENDSSLWVLKVNLNEHVKTFSRKNIESLKSSENMKNFIFENFATSSENDSEVSNFERKLFAESFENQKVVIIFDSFDEVDPFCDSEVLLLLQKLNELNQTVWIATRTHLAGEFETKFSVKCLEMKEFDRSDQIDFMMKYFATKHPSLTSDRRKLNSIVQNLLNRVCGSVSGWKQLTSNPLLTRLVAEINEEEMPRIFAEKPDAFMSLDPRDTLDPFLLFIEFMKLKIKIVDSEKGKKIREEILKSRADPFNGTDFSEVHEKLAMQMIFGIDYDVEENQIKLIQRYGIVVKKIDSLEFSHRSFGEYFAAMFIFKEMKRNLNFFNFFPFLKFLHDAKYDMVKKFLNFALIHSEIHMNEKVYQRVGEHLQTEQTITILHRLIQFENYFLLDVMLKSLSNCDEEFIRHVFQTRGFWSSQDIMNAYFNIDQKGHNLFHHVCYSKIKFLVIYCWEMISKVFGDGASDFFLHEFMHGNESFNVLTASLTGFHWYDPTLYHLETMNFQDLKKFLKSGRREVDKASMNTQFYIEQCVTSTLINIATKINLTEKQKWILFEKCRIPGIITSDYSKLNSLYTIQLSMALKLKNEFFPKKSMENWFCSPANSFSQHDLQSLIVLGFKTYNKSDEIVLKTFEIVKGSVNSSEFKDFLLVMFGTAFKYLRTKENASKLYQILISNHTDSALKKFFKTHRYFHDDIVYYENKEFDYGGQVCYLYPPFNCCRFQYFLYYALTAFKKNHLKALLKNQNYVYNLNILQFIITNCKENCQPCIKKCLDYYLDWLQVGFEVPEIIEMMEKSLYNNLNVLDLTVAHNQTDKFISLLEFIKTKTNKNFTKLQVSSTTLSFIIRNQNKDQLKKVVETMENLWEKKEIEKVLAESEQTILNQASMLPQTEFFQELWSFFSRNLDESCLTNMVVKQQDGAKQGLLKEHSEK